MRLLVAAAFVLSGCSTTLSTLQTARPVQKGHVQISAGYGGYANLGPIGIIVEQAIKQTTVIREAIEKNEQYHVSEEDQQQLLTAGIGLAVMPPSTQFELAVRTGVVKDVDVGLRYSVNALRLDGKYRLLHRGDPEEPAPAPAVGISPPHEGQKHSFDVAIGLGVSRYLFKSPVVDVLEFVQLGDFTRWDFEVPLYLSAELGEVLELYGAPKWVYSRTTLDAKLVDYSQQASNVTGLDLSLPSKVDTHFFGATAGLGVGYKYAHLLLELTAGYTVCQPEVLGRRRSLNGVTLYPAIGLLVRL